MRPGEAGSATVLGLVLVAVLTTVALAAVVVGGVLVGQRRAAAAADLAALAAAEALGGVGGTTAGGVSACHRASLASDANDARMTGCVVEGREVTVQVAVEVRAPFGRTWSVPGAARAGPEARSSGGPGS